MIAPLTDKTTIRNLGEGLGCGIVLMVMPLAVMVAAGVAINDGAIEKHRQHLLHGKFGSSGVDSDAQLIQHIDGTHAQSAAKHIGAALLGQEPRHRAVFMLGCLQHL